MELTLGAANRYLSSSARTICRHIGNRRIYSYILVAIAVLVLSPFLLLVLDVLFNLDWVRLNEIGQSYTGVSAILSAGALLAVARSTGLQSRQIDILLDQTVRDMQFRQLTLAMDNPDLSATYVDVKRSYDSHAEFRRVAFMTMRFRQLEFSFISKALSENGLRRTLRMEVFPSVIAQDFWRHAQSFWDAKANIRPRGDLVRTFAEIVNDEFMRAATATGVLGEEQTGPGTIDANEDSK